MKWFENIIFEMSAPSEHVTMIDAGTEFILKKAKKGCLRNITVSAFLRFGCF